MLVSRNITVGALRTSMRLEPEYWTALADIARMECLTLDALCSLIDARRGDVSRTAAMRLFAMAYLGRSGSDTQPGRVSGPDATELAQPRSNLRAASR